MAQHFDIVAIGAQPSAVLAAALLAKRGRRVLLVDHGEDATSYSHNGYRLPLAPSLIPQLESSPPMQRVHEELGVGPELRSHTRPLSPAFQAILPRHRFDVLADPRALLAEVSVEFPREAPAVGSFLTRLFAADDEISAVLREALPIAPRTLGEKWQARSWKGRAGSYDGPFDPSEWLVGLAADHPLHEVLLSPLTFFGHLAPESPSTLHAVRLLARYFRGVVAFNDRIGGLPAFLVRAARNAGVVLRQGVAATRLGVDGKHLTSIEIEGDREQITADYFIAGTLCPFEELLPPQSTAKFTAEEQAVRPSGSLLVMNILVSADVIPCGMGQALLLLNGRRHQRDGALPDPPLLLQRFPAARGEQRKDGSRPVDVDREVLSVACPVRTADVAHSPDRLASLRTQIFERVARVVPFLRDHVTETSLPVDTGAWDVESDGSRRVDPWRLHPLYETAKEPVLGIAARSPRTWFKNLWHCGHDVVPGLGIEGDYITALATADGILADAGRKWAKKI